VASKPHACCCCCRCCSAAAIAAAAAGAAAGAAAATQALSSPLGAAILAKLDSKRVELVMAAVLLLIIVAEQLSKLVARLSKQKQRSRTTACQCSCQSAGCKAGEPCAAQDCDCLESCDKCGEGCATTGWYAGHDSSPAREPLLQTGSSELAAEPAAECQSDCVVCLPEGQQCPGDASSTKVCKSRVSYHQGSCCCAVLEESNPAGPTPAGRGVWQQQQQQQQQESNPAGPTPQSPCSIILIDDDVGASAAADQQVSEEQQALLPPGQTAAGPAQPDSSSTSSSSIRPAEAPGSSSSRGRWQAVRSWLLVLGIGSIAGSLSGIMEGLTGMSRMSHMSHVTPEGINTSTAAVH